MVILIFILFLALIYNFLYTTEEDNRKILSIKFRELYNEKLYDFIFGPKRINIAYNEWNKIM